MARLRAWLELASSGVERLDRFTKAACVSTAVIILGLLWVQGVSAGPWRYVVLRVAMMSFYTIAASICGYLLRSINTYEALILLAMEACILTIVCNVKKAKDGLKCRELRVDMTEDGELKRLTFSSEECAPVDDLLRTHVPHGDVHQTLAVMKEWMMTAQAGTEPGQDHGPWEHPMVASCMSTGVCVLVDVFQHIRMFARNAKEDIQGKNDRYPVVVLALVLAVSTYTLQAIVNLLMVGFTVLVSSIVTLNILKPFAVVSTPTFMAPVLRQAVLAVVFLLRVVWFGARLLLGCVILLGICIYVILRRSLVYCWMLVLFVLALGFRVVLFGWSKVKALCIWLQLWYERRKVWWCTRRMAQMEKKLRAERAERQQAEQLRQQYKEQLRKQQAAAAAEAAAAARREQQKQQQQRKNSKKGKAGYKPTQPQQQQKQPQEQEQAAIPALTATASQPITAPEVAPADSPTPPPQRQHPRSKGKGKSTADSLFPPAATHSVTPTANTHTAAPAHSVQRTAASTEATGSATPAATSSQAPVIATAAGPPAAAASQADKRDTSGKSTKSKKQKAQHKPLPQIILRPPASENPPSSSATDTAKPGATTTADVPKGTPAASSNPDSPTVLEMLSNSMSWVPVGLRRKRGKPAVQQQQQHVPQPHHHHPQQQHQQQPPLASYFQSLSAGFETAPPPVPPPALSTAPHPTSKQPQPRTAPVTSAHSSVPAVHRNVPSTAPSVHTSVPSLHDSQPNVDSSAAIAPRHAANAASTAPALPSVSMPGTSSVAISAQSFQQRFAALSVPRANGSGAVGEQEVDEDEQLDEDQSLCVVCLAHRRSVGLLHGKSMHLCLCKGCSALFTKDSACPICRQPVVDIVEIYM